MEKGSKHEKAKNYLMALKVYDEAFAMKPNDPRVLLSRSEVKMHLRKYFQAYTDAEKALTAKDGVKNYLSDKNQERAYSLMGQAAYAMRQFARSEDNWKLCLSVNKSNKQAQTELKRSLDRLHERQSGKYDLKRLISQYKSGRLELDVADFESPLIQLVELKSDYKGVVALKSIQKGTLLVVSKAAAIVFDKNLDKSANKKVYY